MNESIGLMFARFDLLPFIPEKQAPGKAKWGDNFDCGICRPPNPDYSFQHIDSEQSGFSGSQHRTNGSRAGLCPECGHICYEEGNEAICSKCGLVQEKLKDESWKAYEENCFWGERESEDWYVDVLYGSFGLPEEFWNKIQYEPHKTHHWHATHLTANGEKGYLDTQFWCGCRLSESYIEECRSRDSCKGCDYHINLSFGERERGRLKGESKNEISRIDKRFSWPAQCLETFRRYPQYATHLYQYNDFSKWLTEWKEYFEKDGYLVEGKTSTGSVKKYRENRDLHWFWRDMDIMGRQLEYLSDTPIGELLLDPAIKTEGTDALDRLGALQMMLNGLEIGCEKDGEFILLKDSLANKGIDFNKSGPTGNALVGLMGKALKERLTNFDNKYKYNNVLMMLKRTKGTPLYYLNDKCYHLK